MCGYILELFIVLCGWGNMRLGTLLGEGGFGVRWSLFFVCPCGSASFRKTAACCINFV